MILMLLLMIYKKKGWRKMLALLLAVGVVILIADQVSSGLIKHAVERLRPTHQPALAGMVHIVNGYTGGKYGFVSSHAANAFGVALIIGLLMRSQPALWALMGWAVLQCYSRMYLGVHYLGDIIGGMVVGLLAAWLAYGLLTMASKRWPTKVSVNFSANDGRTVAHAVAVTVVFIAIFAAFTY